MEQTLNNINIVGVLVKKSLEVRNQGEENECISGSLVLRTEDGSEHEINYFANKYKKDKDGNFTSEESKMYASYETIMTDYISLEDDKELADTIKVGRCEFTANDFKSPKDGNLISTTKLRANFANRLDSQEKETTPKVAKYEISGVVTKMYPETIKDVPTGKGIVMVDVIGYNGTIIPVKLTIDEHLVDAFSKAGFYEGGAGKFNGHIINTKVVETIVEKQAFGEDLVKEITTTKKMNEVCGGSPLSGFEALKITQDEYATAQSKRRLKLDEIKNGTEKGKASSNTQSNQQPTNPFASQQPQSNPFNSTPNPFAR